MPSQLALCSPLLIYTPDPRPPLGDWPGRGQTLLRLVAADVRAVRRQLMAADVPPTR